MRGLLVSVAVVLSGCEGALIAAPNGTTAPALPGAPSGPTGPTDPTLVDPPDSTQSPKVKSFSCASPDARGTSFDRMRRLSRIELRNRLAAVVGGTIAADTDISSRIEGLPDDRTRSAGDSLEGPPMAWAATLSVVAKRAVQLGLADQAWRTSMLGSCATQTITDACVRSAVAKFARPIYQRTLSGTELDPYVQLYTASGGGDAGLSFALRKALQSPLMTFHVEEKGVTDGARIRLSQQEVAARIASLATNTTPDAELFALAEAGDLGTVDAARAQVKRLLESDAGKARLRDFARFYTALEQVPTPPATVLGLHGVQGDGLSAELQKEAFDFVTGVIFSPSQNTFTDLMLGTQVNNPSARLAKVLGVAAGATDAPDHRGLLHRPALLVSAGPRTSPILRGAHLRKLFLCQELGMPDPNVLAAREDEVGDLEAMPNREKVTKLTEAAQCAGCHTLVNPAGFPFEGFDQLGVPRTEEKIFDADGKVAATWPIDTTVDAPKIEVGGPPKLTDSKDLSQAMADSFKARACFAQRAFEYFRLQSLDASADGCALSASEDALHAATLKDALIATIANDDLFFRKAF